MVIQATLHPSGELNPFDEVSVSLPSVEWSSESQTVCRGAAIDKQKAEDGKRILAACIFARLKCIAQGYKGNFPIEKTYRKHWFLTSVCTWSSPFTRCHLESLRTFDVSGGQTLLSKNVMYELSASLLLMNAPSGNEIAVHTNPKSVVKGAIFRFGLQSTPKCFFSHQKRIYGLFEKFRR